MIRLRTLGTLDLRTPDGREIGSVLAQPKRFALLVYLCLSGGRRLHRREHLLALFWPDRDERHARNSLSQALTTLRRGLGPHLLVTRGDEEIGIAAGAIECDAIAFEKALEAGRLEEALERYRGGFLEGLALVDASPGFERWMEDERTRLQALAGRAALELARRSHAAGEIDTALHWVGRANAIAPHDGASVLARMALLADRGDREEALLAYEQHTRWLARELELGPPPELSDLAARLRVDWPADCPAARSIGTEEDRSAPGDVVLASVRPVSPGVPGPDRPPSGSGRVHARRSWLRGPRARPASWPVLAAALLATLTGFALSGPGPAGSPARALAVLPFENLCPDAAGSDLAAGTHTELLTQLSRIEPLQVSSLTAIRRYQGSVASAREIAAELGVGSLLTGSLRCDGDRIRVDVQLIAPRRERIRWAQVYEHRRGELFDIQAEIALSVARELRAHLTSSEREALSRPPTRSEEAYDAYVRAVEYHRRAAFDEEDGRAAERLYRRAIELDPAFSLAVARLAMLHGHFYRIGWDRTAERLRQWQELSAAALVLQPELPEAHLARADYWRWTQDFDRALRELQVVMAIIPSDPDALALRAEIYCRTRRWAECIDSYRTLVRLDPNTPSYQAQLAFGLWFMRRFPEAVAAYDRVLEMAPDDHLTSLYRGRVFVDWLDTTDTLAAALRELPPEWDPDGTATLHHILLAWLERRPEDLLAATETSRQDALIQWRFDVPFSLLRGYAYAALGEQTHARQSFLEAIEFLEGKIREGPPIPIRHALLGQAYAGIGRRDDALREITQAGNLEPLSRDAIEGAAVMEHTAAVLARLGETDAAVRQLEVLMANPSPLSIPRLRREERWDPLRGHPRFELLLRSPLPVLP